MLLLSQAPVRALSTSNCSFSSPSRIPTLNPTLFSNSKPKFASRNSRRTINLTVTNAERDGGDSASATKQAFSSSSQSPYSNDETVFVGEEAVPLEGVIQFEKPNSPSKLNKWGRIALMAGGDVLALLLFSAIGRFNHGFPVLNVETLHTADPFIAGWFLSAYFLGGYGDDGRGSNGLSKAVVTAVKSWAVGIPLGLIIRAATSGHIPQVSFMMVTMGSTATLLIGWRALLLTVLPGDNSKKNDMYKQGSPFELFELLTSLVRRW
ncbi:PREDICTED: uncharacterized protein LOC104609068 [Nelumbo nucifera]|uniref:Uncharacterized protein LOC104609068 n=1 Tax=Nelumbo nucifera TaxID=4432 RepID=A0A1U8BBK2_NELNU|nr:PREDICTED: uncharacterized protein LOC104609068 [Nelumbo nucifera]